MSMEQLSKGYNSHSGWPLLDWSLGAFERFGEQAEQSAYMAQPLEEAQAG